MRLWRLGLLLAVLVVLPRVTAKNDEDEEEENDAREESLKIPKIHNPSTRRSADDGEDDDEDDDDDDDDDGGGDKADGERGAVASSPSVPRASGRRSPAVMSSESPQLSLSLVRSSNKKRPLECYVCAYKSETPLRACLDPTKFRSKDDEVWDVFKKSELAMALKPEKSAKESDFLFRVHTITCHSTEDKCFTSVISKGESYEAVVRGCRSGCVGSPETTCCDQNRCNNQAFAMPLIQQRSELKTPASKATSCSPPTILFFVSVLLLLQTAMKVAIV